MYACTLDPHCHFGIRARAVVEKRLIMPIHNQDRGAPKLAVVYQLYISSHLLSCRCLFLCVEGKTWPPSLPFSSLPPRPWWISHKSI